MKRIIKLSVVYAILFSGCSVQKELHLPKNVSDFVGMHYEEVTNSFQEAGFKTIMYEKIEDITSDSDIADGSVEKLLINDNDDFDESSPFPLDSTVTIVYHEIPRIEIPEDLDVYKSLPQEDLVKQLEKLGFTNLSINEIYDLDPDKYDSFYNDIAINDFSSLKAGDKVLFDSLVTITTHYPYEIYETIIHIDFVPNLIFSKYNVDLFLNDEKQGTLTHGEDGDFTFKLREGEYNLSFVGLGSEKTTGDVKLEISCDVEAEYKINCYKDKIEVETVYVDNKSELAEDEVKILKSNSSYRYENYEAVEKELKEMGFLNIQKVPVYDIYFGLTEVGSVDELTINGSKEYRRGDVFKNSDPIIIKYHLSYEDDPNRESTASSSNEKKDSAGSVTSSQTSGKSTEVLTIDNNSDLASILTAEYVDADVQQQFVKKYYGETIEFNAIVLYLFPHEDSEWVVTYVLAPTSSEKDIMGAALFMIEDATFMEFKWDSKTRPEYVTVKSKMRIRAKISSGYDEAFIYLRPVKTWGL